MRIFLGFQQRSASLRNPAMPPFWWEASTLCSAMLRVTHHPRSNGSSMGSCYLAALPPTASPGRDVCASTACHLVTRGATCVSSRMSCRLCIHHLHTSMFKVRNPNPIMNEKVTNIITGATLCRWGSISACHILSWVIRGRWTDDVLTSLMMYVCLFPWWKKAKVFP